MASLTDGLTTAEVAQRVAEGQVNQTTGGTQRSLGDVFRANLLTPVNLIMVTLFGLIVAAGFPRDGLFVGVVVANVVIGVWQELKARRELRRLEVLNTAPIRVVRNGVVQEIDSSDLVLGDVIQVGSGDQIVADGQVLVSTGLLVDESLLTGESDAISKPVGAEVQSGSYVATGSGRIQATSVGDASYANSLAQEAKRFGLVNSELRTGINTILRVLMVLIPPASLLLYLSLQSLDDGWQAAMQGTVAAAVAMVPDGLVLLTSLAFLAGVLSLTRQNALAKELATVELLARVDTLCLDKTGTITTGDIVLAEFKPLGDADPAFVEQALGAIAHTDPDPNPTMRALRDATVTPGWTLVRSQPFSSATKWSGTEFDGRGAFVFGAPDILFSGDESIAATLEDYGSQGYRVLGLAHSSAPLGAELALDRRPLALILMQDKIRPDANEILRFFVDQGVEIKVISGDNVSTVAAVAERAGVPHASSRVDARTLPTQASELADAVDATTIFGRVTPHQKQAMVGALQSRGHVVAMTGDGVNDVLALKDADMGIAMGSGSAATRGVAQLVLLDNKFATLPNVLAQGRRVINNIERVANLFVAKAVYAVLLTVVIGLQQVPFPFLPRQLTLIGTFSIGLPGLFLALAASDALVKPGFLTRVLRFSIPAGLIAGAGTWLVYTLARTDDATTLAQARSLATITLLGLGLVILVSASRPLRLWKIGLAAAMASAYAVIVAVGPFRRFFELELAGGLWWAPVAATVAVGGALIVAVAHWVSPTE